MTIWWAQMTRGHLTRPRNESTRCHRPDAAVIGVGAWRRRPLRLPLHLPVAFFSFDSLAGVPRPAPLRRRLAGRAEPRKGDHLSAGRALLRVRFTGKARKSSRPRRRTNRACPFLLSERCVSLAEGRRQHPLPGRPETSVDDILGRRFPAKSRKDFRSVNSPLIRAPLAARYFQSASPGDRVDSEEPLDKQ